MTFAGSSDEDPERERELIEGVLARRVDGLILVPTATTTPICRATSRRASRVVFVDRPPQSIDADCVLSDNRGGARAAVAHLIAHGHRADRVRRLPAVLYTAVERLAGYREGAARGGVADEIVRHPVETRRLFDGALLRTTADGAVHRAEPDHGRGPARAAPARPPAPVAHVGFDDILLAGAIEPA